MPNFINQMMLAEVKTLVDASPSLIVLDPAKLNSAQTLKLRADLRAAGAQLKVAKVAILERCVPEGAKAMLNNKSTIGLVLAKDMLSAAKVVAELAKDDKITLKGGVMDGKVVDTASIKRLAELPDQLTLRGMLVNILAAPLTGMARVIAEIHKKKAGDAPAA
ncbi:MAG: 50S ribosomal protein L10 [Planctomycetes bacterium]|nr:50S ribosomal protein L10 [Planctomycetota bacterium]